MKGGRRNTSRSYAANDRFHQEIVKISAEAIAIAYGAIAANALEARDTQIP
jgi:hypothetical protein